MAVGSDVRDGGEKPRDGWPAEPLADLAARRDALRQAAGLPGADLSALADAALTELDGAIDALTAVAVALASPDEPPAENMPEAVRAERRLLHAAFQQAPVPLFLLEQDGTIRRANGKAAELLGAPSGYPTGKPLTAFLDIPLRAAVRTQLAAVTRTGKPWAATCRVLSAGGPLDVRLAAAAVELPGDPSLLVVTATAPADGGGTHGGEPAARPPGEKSAGQAPAAAADWPDIAAITRRLDMVTAVTRVLLDNSTFSEAVTLQRCARLLAGDLADWALIDMDRGGQLRRQYAAGPVNGAGGSPSGAGGGPSRAARATDPDQESLPWQVYTTGKPVLLANVDDTAVLGAGPGGTPLLMTLGVTSLICVPLSDGAAGYGTLTLARTAARGPFGVADLGLAEELGRHLGVAVRVDRMFRRRSEVAEALQASLLPAGLPTTVPGLEFAAAYIGATQWQEISGDFYDVFQTADGWAIAIGDVCGKGQDAAAVTAAARHATRALAHVHKSPEDVLAAVNEVLLAGDYGERFVTASLAFLRRRGQRVQVRLGSCGHPGPALVRADGRVEILEGDGLPLGLFGDATPDRLDAELRPGDLLFFYTDGVTEAQAADRSFFEDRLADELAAVAGGTAAQVVRAVQDLVSSFSQGELRDDVTILAVRVTPETPPKR